MQAVKKVVVVGGGYAQLSLLEAFMDIPQLKITVVDDRPRIPSREQAGISVVNIHRYNSERITEWAKANSTDYVAGSGSDKSVFIAATIADKLNLPFYCSAAVAEMPMKKGQIQQVLREAGVPIPETMEGSDIGCFKQFLQNACYPLVVKPDEGIGQAAVNLASCYDEAVESLKIALSESPNGRALLQEYCDGREIGINGIVIEGEFYLLTTAFRNSSRARGGAFGVAMEKIIIELSDTIKQGICATLTKACNAIGIVNAPIYAQAILTKDDRVVIIEIMPRLGGGEDSRLVKLATGYDLAEATAAMSLGRKAIRPTIGSPKRTAALKFLTIPPGLIQGISGIERAASVPGIRVVKIYYKLGQEIKQIASSRERGGYLLAEGASSDSVLTSLELAERMITFNVLPIIYDSTC